LLTSIAARVGPDVAYALLVVFTLTYATTILHLPRALALTATVIGAACNAVGIPVFASLSDRVGRRPVYAVGAVLSILWAFAYFSLMDTRQPLLIDIAVAGARQVRGLVDGVHAHGDRRRRRRATAVQRAIPGVRLDGQAVVVRDGGAGGNADFPMADARDGECAS
jgi:hypothetical protein